LISVNESRVVYNTGSGPLIRLGWVGADDGILSLDRNGDGIINNRREISFSEDFEGATTDLEGLQGFDSNADGVLDASDDMWSSFTIWQDHNQNGVGTASEQMTLEEAGIVSLSLTLSTTGQQSSHAADSVIVNTAIATMADGSEMTAHDVALRMMLARVEGSALPTSADWEGFDLSTDGTFGVAYSGDEFDVENIASLMTMWNINDAGAEGATWSQLLQHIDLEDVLEAPERVIDPDDPQTQTFGVQPVVIDMDGDGIELINPGQSAIELDANNDGALDRIGWVSPDDGMLALDRNGDGSIEAVSEISFVQDLEGATTDLEGLRAYDSNNDGWLDAADARFGDFQIWVDSDYDAISNENELMSLSEAGLERLSLTSMAGTGSAPSALANTVFGEASIVWSQGSVGGNAGDVELRAYTGDLQEQMYDRLLRQFAEQRATGPWAFGRNARRQGMMDLASEGVDQAGEADERVVPLGKYAHGRGRQGMADLTGNGGGVAGGMGGFNPNTMLSFKGAAGASMAAKTAANDSAVANRSGPSRGDMQRWWLAFAGDNGSTGMGMRTLGDRLAALDVSREQIAPGGVGRAGMPQQDAGSIAEQQRFLQAIASFSGSSGVATVRKGDHVTSGQHDLFADRSQLSRTADGSGRNLYG
jgi:hypothetical protein